MYVDTSCQDSYITQSQSSVSVKCCALSSSTPSSSSLFSYRRCVSVAYAQSTEKCIATLPAPQKCTSSSHQMVEALVFMQQKRSQLVMNFSGKHHCFELETLMATASLNGNNMLNTLGVRLRVFPKPSGV